MYFLCSGPFGPGLVCTGARNYLFYSKFCRFQTIYFIYSQRPVLSKSVILRIVFLTVFGTMCERVIQAIQAAP